VIVHAAIFSASQNLIKIPDLTEQGRSTLAIDINQHAIKHEAVKQAPELKRLPEIVTSQPSSKSSKPVQKQATKLVAEKTQLADNTKKIESQSPQKPQADQAQISTLLKTELTKYFYYPSIAQRRLWQGQVLIEFTIFPTGVINNIKIKESSGYSVLDSAAIKAIKKIKQQEQFSLALNGHHSNQILPVTYKLVN